MEHTGLLVYANVNLLSKNK